MNDKNLLKSRRLALGLSQKEVAEKSGLAWAQVQRLDSGATPFSKITAKTAIALATALQMNMDDLRNIIEEEALQGVKDLRGGRK